MFLTFASRCCSCSTFCPRTRTPRLASPAPVPFPSPCTGYTAWSPYRYSDCTSHFPNHHTCDTSTNTQTTRIHSSRICTARCRCLLLGRDVCLGRGSVCLGRCLPRGCLPRGCLPRGVSAYRDVCPGVSAQGVPARCCPCE